MKSHINKSIIALAIILGFGLGAIALSTLASTWTSPTQAPPQGNSDAPINVGVSHQVKLGSLSINTTTTNPDVNGLDVFGISRFFGKVKIVDGSQGDGKVLTSNADGLASWSTSAVAVGGGAGGGFTNFQVFDNSSSWTVPAGVTKIMVEVWGGGGGGSAIGAALNNGVGTNSRGGGGGGGYGKGIYSVTPNTTYSIAVGDGGAVSGNGSASSFGSLIYAEGGTAPDLVNPGRGGIGGSSNGQMNISGQYGQYVYSSNSLYSTIGGSAGMGGGGAGVGDGNCISQRPGGGGSYTLTWESYVVGGGMSGRFNGRYYLCSGAPGRVIVWW